MSLLGISMTTSAECDSDSGLYKPRAQWIKDNVGADYWESGTKRGIAKQEWSRTSMRNIMKRYNQTGGFHTLQRRSGCEIREDGGIGGSWQLAYDGDDFLSFDMNTYTWVAAVKEAEITQRRWNENTADLQYRKQYTEKGCIEWLTKYHQYGKEALQGRGKKGAGYSPPGSYQGSNSSTENKLVGEGTSVPA